MSFVNDIKIDKFSLDEEWMKQPRLVEHWSFEYSELIFKREKLKEKIELFKADLDSKIRGTPSNYGLEKITEAAISSAITKQPEMIELQSEMIALNKECNIVQGALKALEHKKKALEFMTQLFFSGYWADPKISSEVKKKILDDSESMQKEEVHEKLNKGRLPRRK